MSWKTKPKPSKPELYESNVIFLQMYNLLIFADFHLNALISYCADIGVHTLNYFSQIPAEKKTFLCMNFCPVALILIVF